MTPTRRRILGAVAASASIAGCIGDEPTPVAPAPSTGTATDSSPTGDGTDAATVQVRSHDELGQILVGPEGMTLYMFDSDTQGAAESTCTGGCAGAWPPLTVEGQPSSGDGVTAELSTFQREDGATQVAAAGWPLYYFDSDEQPGDVQGQGVSDVWWVLRPDGTPVRAGTETESPTTTEGGASGPGGDDY